MMKAIMLDLPTDLSSAYPNTFALLKDQAATIQMEGLEVDIPYSE